MVPPVFFFFFFSYFPQDHEKHGVAPNATAIQINGNDHYVLNTIVFSSKIGLEVNGAADYITGTHGTSAY